MGFHTSVLEKARRAPCGGTTCLVTWRESHWINDNSSSLLAGLPSKPFWTTIRTGWGLQAEGIFFLFFTLNSWIKQMPSALVPPKKPLQCPFCKGCVPEIWLLCPSSICWPKPRPPLPPSAAPHHWRGRLTFHFTLGTTGLFWLFIVFSSTFPLGKDACCWGPAPSKRALLAAPEGRATELRGGHSRKHKSAPFSQKAPNLLPLQPHSASWANAWLTEILKCHQELEQANPTCLFEVVKMKQNILHHK